jgi:hypothetical protein
MPDKNGKRDTQKTDEGYELPVPKRGDVMDVFGKAAKKQPAEKPSQSETGKRRTSRDDQ